MTNPTSNYGFVLPTATDLVTDLPADFDVALQGVDTRLKALQPGTTLGDIAYSSATANTNTRLGIGSNGQVLSVSGGVPAWATPNPGDITGVTAGVGISGGGTSGDVTVTNDMATTITAAGDIVVGTGAGTYDNLPIGTTNQVLTADTTVSPYKVKWATPTTGDIEGVTAGIGISGGGTSGTVTVTNSMATAIDAKGDLVAGTGADTFSRLGVGANDTVLTADSAQATGLKWATPASGGETLLSTTAITAASSITISGISSAYNSLRIAVVNMAFSSSNDYVTLRFNGVTTSDYGWTCIQNQNSPSVTSSANSTSIQLANQYQSAANTNNGLFNIEIPQYANTTCFKTCTFTAQAIGSSNKANWFGSGGLNQTGAISSVTLIIGAGTFTAQGSILIYGVK